jgi:hypothetical protein
VGKSRGDRPKDYSTISEIDWAMAAAYIDGEGCIAISPVTGTTHRSLLSIQIANTDPRLPLWLKATFGGNYHTYKPVQRRCKQVYVWSVRAGMAEDVLRGCLSYFKLKRDQAEIGLAYRATYAIAYCTRKPIPNEVTEKRESLRQEMISLHRKEFVQ